MKMEIEDLGRKFATGELSIDQTASELMKLRKVPTENFSQKKAELKKLLEKTKQGTISQEQFLDETMKITCDMSDKEHEIGEQEGYDFFPLTEFSEDRTVELVKKIIARKYVPWDFGVEILLQIGINILLGLKEKPKQRITAYGIIVASLGLALTETEVDKALSQVINEHKQIRQHPELRFCSNMTVKDVLKHR